MGHGTRYLVALAAFRIAFLFVAIGCRLVGEDGVVRIASRVTGTPPPPWWDDLDRGAPPTTPAPDYVVRGGGDARWN